jgi:hypothetical protein
VRVYPFGHEYFGVASIVAGFPTGTVGGVGVVGGVVGVTVHADPERV